MDAKEMRDMSPKEITEHLATARKDLFGLRFSNATGELENTAGIARAKREIARTLTVIRERELHG